MAIDSVKYENKQEKQQDSILLIGYNKCEK